MSRHVIEHLLNLAEDFKPSPTTVTEITEAIAARSALRHREVSPWEVQEIIRSITGVEIPIERVRFVIHGNDRVYVLLKLRPQFPSNELVEEVEGWKGVEQVNEVYGDIDVILLARRVNASGVELVDRLRNRFKDAIISTVTLPVE